MKQFLYLGIALVGGVVLALGLIFLCAATSDAARLPLAVILLVLGAIIAGGSGYFWWQARARSPEQLATRFTELAKASGHAELSIADAMSSTNASAEEVQAAFALLERKNQAHRTRRADREVYVFPGLEEKKMVRRCQHCGREYSIKEAVYTCTNCGGQVEVVRE